MTGDPIYDNAMYWALQHRLWLVAATSPRPQLTRRECLREARKAEHKIINCAISAELRAEHAMLTGARK